MSNGVRTATTEDVRAYVAALVPGCRATKVRRLGEGLDHVAWLVDDALVVRVAKDVSSARASVLRESALLDLVATVSPIPTPRLVAASPDDGIIVSTFLVGTTLLGHGAPPAADAAEAIGAFLSTLHRIPDDEAALVAEVDTTPTAEWLEAARADWDEVATCDEIAPPTRATIAEFLREPPPANGERRVLCHGDLGSEHLLVDDRGTIVGVIDWGDAARADPAVDFARLLRDFGEPFARAVHRHYASTFAAFEANDWSRARFFARCAAIEDLAHAKRSNDRRYRDGALRAFGDLFAAANAT